MSNIEKGNSDVIGKLISKRVTEYGYKLESIEFMNDKNTLRVTIQVMNILKPNNYSAYVGERFLTIDLCSRLIRSFYSDLETYLEHGYAIEIVPLVL
jgi:ribosome maturation factor RimP